MSDGSALSQKSPIKGREPEKKLEGGGEDKVRVLHGNLGPGGPFSLIIKKRRARDELFTEGGGGRGGIKWDEGTHKADHIKSLRGTRPKGTGGSWAGEARFGSEEVRFCS